MNKIFECYASSKHEQNRKVFIRDLNSLIVATSCTYLQGRQSWRCIGDSPTQPSPVPLQTIPSVGRQRVYDIAT